MTDVQASPGPPSAQASPRPQDWLAPCLWPSIVLRKAIVASTAVCKPFEPFLGPVWASVFMAVPSHR